MLLNAERSIDGMKENRTVSILHDTESNLSSIIFNCSQLLYILNTNTEKDFLTIGGELQTILGESTIISEAALSASRLVNSAELNENMVRIREMFDAISEHFGLLQKRLRESSDALTGVLTSVAAAEIPLPSFRRIVKHLSILGISAKIENARLTTGDNSFFALAEDVEKLSHIIAEKSEGIQAGLAALGASINMTLQRINVLRDTQHGRTRNTLDNIRGILGTLSEKRALSSVTTNGLVTKSEGIGAALSKVVSSLQFHDITRQQIEHVAVTLDEIGQMDHATEKDSQIVAGLIARVGQLQSNQLVSAREELVSAVRRVIHELGVISNTTSAMSGETKALLGGTNDRGTSFLNELTTSLSSVVTFLQENEDTNRRLFEALQLVSRTTGEISEFATHIEDIGEEIELIALNARIKAAHSDEKGAALSVIAEAIARLSEGTRTLTTGLTVVLKDICSSTDGMKAAEDGHDKESGNTRGIQELAEEAEGLMAAARRSDEHVSSLLDSLERRTVHLTEAIDKTNRNITVHIKADKEIGEILKKLNSLIESSRSGSFHEENSRIREYLDGLADRYTMQQERHIHSHIVETVDTSIDKKSPETDVDSLGDNIELF